MKNLVSNQKNLGELKVESWAPRWWAVFLIGLALWIAAVGSVFLTGDLIVLPTVVLLGSFLVPVTAVVWYLDHDPSPALSPRRMMSAFLIAGVLGILAAAVLEYWLVYGPGLRGNLKVGFIEEFVKGAATREQRLRACLAVRRPGTAPHPLVVVRRLHGTCSRRPGPVRSRPVVGDPRRRHLPCRPQGSPAADVERARRLCRRVAAARGVRRLRHRHGVHRHFDHRARAARVPLASAGPGIALHSADAAGPSSGLTGSPP